MKTNQQIFSKSCSLSFFSLKLHEGLRRKQTLEASSRCQALRRKVRRRRSRRPTPFYSLSLSLCLFFSSETSWRLSKSKTSLEDTRIIKSEDSSRLPRTQSRHHPEESYKSGDEDWRTTTSFFLSFPSFLILSFRLKQILIMMLSSWSCWILAA